MNWCVEKFEPAHAEEIAECYNAFFNAYIRPNHPLYDGASGSGGAGKLVVALLRAHGPEVGLSYKRRLSF